MRGSRTPEKLREAFRAEYLYSGNAAASGRKVGIKSRHTARAIAIDLHKDPAFIQARAELRARMQDDAERRLDNMLNTAERRFNARQQPPIPGPDGTEIAPIDRRSEYGRLIVDGYRAIATRIKNDADIAKAAQPAPSDAPAINIFLADGTKVERTEPAPTEPEKPKAKP